MGRFLTGDMGLRLLLSVAVVLPYWPLATFRVIYVTDAVFTSDIFNGELAGRALAASILRSGHWPVWTNQLCSGLPLAGLPADPLSLVTFGLLPTAVALDAFVIVLLLVAAHGTYSLARQLDADRAGASLAAIAFAGCGSIAAQLMHLGIIGTVVWLPVGLLLLDRAFADPIGAIASPAKRGLNLALYGLVFGNQVLSGFPQTAYICALVYAAFALFKLGRIWWLTRAVPPVWLVVGFTAASLLGATAGTIVLLPLSALGALSDRSEGLGYEWATAWSYWPPDVLTFFDPYHFGDIATNTYRTPGFFWEDYGYLGLLPALLSAYGIVHKRRPASLAFIKALTLIAFLFVLGRYTPVYRIAYEVLPGLSVFRGPTRFLFVVDIGLALLAGVGLTRLIEDGVRSLRRGSRIPAATASAVCLLTVLDLTFHQARRNPMVQASEWLAPPPSVAAIRADNPQPRTFTPNRFELHIRANADARGWVDLDPYFRLRSVLEPNLGGGYWNVPSADCYVGVSPMWYVNVWGDHNRTDGLISRHSAIDLDGKQANIDDIMPTLLRTYGVTHLVSQFPVHGKGLTPVGGDADAYAYRVEGTARARVVPTGVAVANDTDAAARLAAPGFDPSMEVLLHGAALPVSSPSTPPSADHRPGRAAIRSESATEVVIDADSDAGGYLVLADTFHPDWTAEVDGVPAPIVRANISTRAVPVQRGTHQVRFTFHSTIFLRGLMVSGIAIATLIACAIASAKLR
jgi:hypothetical protein